MTEPTPTRYGDGVAVVVVTYFPGDDLVSFLDTLEKASTRDVRVVLADNSADPASDSAYHAEVLEKAARRENVQLLRIGENLGYGGGANRGVAELDDSYGWVVIANPDLEWEPGSLDVLVEAGRRWPRGGAFGPLIREPDGSVYPSARLLPSIGRGIGHALFAKVWPANPWTRAYRQERAPEERTSGWLSGSCQLIRREAWDSVGGFDPRYFMYFEDVDLGDRIGRAGWHNVYVPSAAVTHAGGNATSRVAKKMLAAHHESAYRFLADRHHGVVWKPVLAAIKLGLALRLKIETRGQ